MYTASVSGWQEWPCVEGCLLCFTALRDRSAGLLHSCIFSSLWSVVFDLSACLSGFPLPHCPLRHVQEPARGRTAFGQCWCRKFQSNQRHNGLFSQLRCSIQINKNCAFRKEKNSITLWAILLAKDIRRNRLIFFACLEVTYKIAQWSGSNVA